MLVSYGPRPLAGCWPLSIARRRSRSSRSASGVASVILRGGWLDTGEERPERIDDEVDLHSTVGCANAHPHQRLAAGTGRREYQIDIDAVLNQRMPECYALLGGAQQHGDYRAGLWAEPVAERCQAVVEPLGIGPKPGAQFGSGRNHL